ncbi:MAG: hypothetical protein ACLSBB_14200 [Ruthenibacterium lactatiformans]
MRNKHRGLCTAEGKGIATSPSPRCALQTITFPDMRRYLDDRAARLLHAMALRTAWQRYPAALAPWYGIAEHSAFLGERSLLRGHQLAGPGAGRRMRAFRPAMDEANQSLRLVVDGIAYLRERYEGQFFPMTRGVSGALEMANTLRGSDFFYDFYEDPDALKELLKYCAHALVWYYDKQLEAAGQVFGGTITGFGEWLPGRAVGQLSEDTTTMISRAQFEEFGRPLTQEICTHYDSAFMHTHALSEHSLPAIASIPGIRAMELSSDPNTDRAVEVYKRNREALAGPVPVLRLTRGEIESNFELLKSQKTIVWYDASCMEDAQDMAALFAREFPVR